MPNAEYMETERAGARRAGEDDQPRISADELPVIDAGGGTRHGARRRYRLLLCGVVVLLSALLLSWWRHQQYYRPPAFRLALQRSQFLCDPLLGAAADMKIGRFRPGMGEEIAVVGAGAVFYTDLSGRLQSRVDFAVPGDGMQLVPERGRYSFLQPGFTNRLAVMDSQGKPRWTLGGDCHAGRYAAGDLYGNGQTEYVVGCLTPAAGCLRLLDAHGQIIWERADREAFFHDCAVIDARGDGRREVAYPDRDRLVLLDGRGQIAGAVHLPVPLETYTLCPWPTPASRPAFLTVHDTLLCCIGMDGRLLAHRYLPGDYYDSASYCATPVNLRAGEPPYLAVALNNGQGRLLLYDWRGAIVHEEKLSEECSGLFAIPSAHDSRTQDLLLCSEGMVWRLSAGTAAPVR